VWSGGVEWECGVWEWSRCVEREYRGMRSGRMCVVGSHTRKRVRDASRCQPFFDRRAIVKLVLSCCFTEGSLWAFSFLIFRLYIFRTSVVVFVVSINLPFPPLYFSGVMCLFSFHRSSGERLLKSASEDAVWEPTHRTGPVGLVAQVLYYG